jgi:hypothetical protein
MDLLDKYPHGEDTNLFVFRSSLQMRSIVMKYHIVLDMLYAEILHMAFIWEYGYIIFI